MPGAAPRRAGDDGPLPAAALGAGLDLPQYLIIVLLWQEGTASVGAIGAGLGLGSSTLSPLLQRLEGRSLLTRVRSRHDERRVDVVLAPAGQALHRRAAEVPARISGATGLSAPEQAALVEDLRRLALVLSEDMWVAHG